MMRSKLICVLVYRYSEGNNFFKLKKYEEAIEKYTEAIQFDPADVTFYSNRSACFAALAKWQQAYEDGRQCVITDKSFVKGYFRAALALQNLNNLDDALDYIKRGLGIDSTNADLKKMSREIEEAQRVAKVDGLYSQAKTQMSSNDIYGAFKTVDSALRLDPQNTRLNNLMKEIRPQYERAEKQRVGSLRADERLKEEGDKFFKDAKFEEAIKAYSKALDAISDKSSELALKVFSKFYNKITLRILNYCVF